MKLSTALSIFVACAFLQGCMATAKGKSGLSPAPAPTANTCRDAITPFAKYGTYNFARLERKEIEARLREIATRTSADPRARQQLACLMKR